MPSTTYSINLFDFTPFKVELTDTPNQVYVVSFFQNLIYSYEMIVILSMFEVQGDSKRKPQFQLTVLYLHNHKSPTNGTYIK